VRLYLAPYLGPVLLSELSAAHVQAMLTAIIRHHQAVGTPVSPATPLRGSPRSSSRQVAWSPAPAAGGASGTGASSIAALGSQRQRAAASRLATGCSLRLSSLREVGEVGCGECFEGEAEGGAVGHPAAEALADGDGDVAVEQLVAGPIGRFGSRSKNRRRPATNW
jgi:hypothetical protein